MQGRRHRGTGAVTGPTLPRPARGRRAAVPSTVVVLLAVTALAVLAPEDAAAQAMLTQQEALRLAFGEDAEIERRTAFLEPTEVERAGELAGSGVDVEELLVTHYVARRGGEPVGVAYFDAHTVRTLTEVLMIVVGPDDRVERVEVLRFDEPRDYLPPAGWLDEFDGVELSDGSARDVPNITGATLTSDAVEDAVRRTLALHDVIDPFGDDGDGASGAAADDGGDVGGSGAGAGPGGGEHRRTGDGGGPP